MEGLPYGLSEGKTIQLGVCVGCGDGERDVSISVCMYWKEGRDSVGGV